jgi:hypothetical protein
MLKADIHGNKSFKAQHGRDAIRLTIGKGVAYLVGRKVMSDTEVRSEVFILCGVVTVRLKVLYSIVVPPGEEPINQLTDPNPHLKPGDNITILT